MPGIGKSVTLRVGWVTRVPGLARLARDGLPGAVPSSAPADHVVSHQSELHYQDQARGAVSFFLIRQKDLFHW